MIGSSHRRRAKSPLGPVLIRNLLGKGLTPRSCIGDGGSIWWAPVLIYKESIYARVFKKVDISEIYINIYIPFVLFRAEKQKIYIFLKYQPFWKRVCIYILLLRERLSDKLKCKRQPRKVLWVVLISLFFQRNLKENPWTYVCEC